jgi:hypothetical protein
MDDRTLTALQASIKHWEDNVAAEAVDDASTRPGSCALCREFYYDGNACFGCPVADKVRSRHCTNTPYIGASAAWHDWRRGVGSRRQWREFAQAELDFLRSLLPVQP